MNVVGKKNAEGTTNEIFIVVFSVWQVASLQLVALTPQTSDIVASKHARVAPLFPPVSLSLVPSMHLQTSVAFTNVKIGATISYQHVILKNSNYFQVYMNG